jgi:hypothetical protein
MVVAQASSVTQAQQLLEQRLLSIGGVKAIAIVVTLTLALSGFSTANAQGSLITLRGWDGHGHAFDLTQLRGSVVALTFTSRYTQEEALRVHGALAGRRDVKVVSIVDFVGIPSIAHGYARRRVAEADGDGGRVIHLCDEKSQLRGAFGAHPDKRVDIFVIDREGGLRGHFVGAQLSEAMRLVDAVRTTQALR